ncbi:Disease resistance protein [Quillaja saponaria]|uniref:Disease resistance protein n=1 Tax=Quillaja saponaria TaxID=32244 RepID=A0AAD7PBW4_QUISA|nr:Disease resistance protein [Quillaja saponaria]
MTSESLLLVMANKTIGRLGSLALEELGILWNVKDNLRKTKNSVSAFKSALLDAEEKQATDPGIRIGERRGEEEVIGREEEKKAVIELLLNTSVKEHVSVVSVVGIGGQGKTALTQLVYNDKIIHDNFELKMWVCVSDDFNVQSIVAKIVRCPTNTEIEQLQQDLRKKIEGKRYLLVLDDVWNENNERWVKLKSLLIGGANGNQIIIATRSERVAEITRTISSFHLKGLNKDKSWALFARVAFESEEETHNRDLIVIGEEIVRKCMEVPLARRTIGSMLYFNNSEEDLLYLKNTDLVKINPKNNDIFPILKLSYDHFEPHLKTCFAYCSLFPKDYPINKKKLIQLWMAQGFIQPLDENKCMEDTGEEYFMDLYWRSFFQEIQRDECVDIRSCKMHDLIHDLAQLVDGNECTLTDVEGKKIHERTCHASINAGLGSSSKIPTWLAKEFLPNLTSLNELTINNSPRLKSVSPILQHLSALHRLNVNGCNALDLSNDEEDGDCSMQWKEFSSLRTLILDGLPNWCPFRRIFNMLPP